MQAVRRAHACEVLGINHNASTKEISKAYKQLALIHHPDKSSCHQAAEKFKQIREAYETLLPMQIREAYDMVLHIPCTIGIQKSKLSGGLDPLARNNLLHRRCTIGIQKSIRRHVLVPDVNTEKVFNGASERTHPGIRNLH